MFKFAMTSAIHLPFDTYVHESVFIELYCVKVTYFLIRGLLLIGSFLTNVNSCREQYANFMSKPLLLMSYD